MKGPEGFELELDYGTSTLIVNGFSTSDREIFNYFSEVPENEMEDRFATALKVGVVALKVLGTTERVDYVEKCFSKMEHEMDTIIEDTFGERGKLKIMVEEYFGENGRMSRAMETTFGEEGRFDRTLQNHFGPDGKLVKEVFDLINPESPLAKLKHEFERHFEDLRKDLKIEIAVEEEMRKSVRKGRKFEDDLEPTIDDIAKSMGDMVERTGDKSGFIHDSKVGDFVISIGDCPEIGFVIEAKDKKVKDQEIREEMRKAIANRGVQYGLMVCKDSSCLPDWGRVFSEYGRSIAVISLGDEPDSPLQEDYLRLGYKWARSRALNAMADIKPEIDTKFILDKIEETKKLTTTLVHSKRLCTQIKGAADQIYDKMEEVKQTLEKDLDAINTELVRVRKD